MKERAAIAAELADLALRLADLAQRVQEAEREGADTSATPNSETAHLLTAAEVVARTGLSRGRVYVLGRQGEAGAVRVGERGVRFSERGLAEWMRNGGVR